MIHTSRSRAAHWPCGSRERKNWKHSCTTKKTSICRKRILAAARRCRIAVFGQRTASSPDRRLGLHRRFARPCWKYACENRWLAIRSDDGLVVDGTSFVARTSTLPRDLLEKTLEVRVRLKTLQQSGGGAISVQTLSGDTFDAIVFAEQQPARWMAGSDSFQRTESFRGSIEEKADQEAVLFTQVYQADGTILGYRNGEFTACRSVKDPVTFGAATSQVSLRICVPGPRPGGS